MGWRCCVPLCRNNYTRARSEERLYPLSGHSFPSEEKLKKQWLVRIRRYAGRKFRIPGGSKVCSDHFLGTDFKPRLNSKLKSLKPGAVPSLFEWDQVEIKCEKGVKPTETGKRPDHPASLVGSPLSNHEDKEQLVKQEMDNKERSNIVDSVDLLIIESISSEKTEKNFQCKNCQMFFRTIYQLSDHCDTMCETKPFQCDQCQKTYFRRFYLNSHKSIHSNLPFKCSNCERSFFTYNHLTRHERTHNTVSGQEIYTCHICNHTLTTKCSHLKHLKAHKDSVIKGKLCNEQAQDSFKCDVCSESFDDERILLAHKWVHTGIKPFKCGECRKSFSYESELGKHLKSHSETKRNVSDKSINGNGKKGLLTHKQKTVGSDKYQRDIRSRTIDSKDKREARGQKRYSRGKKPFGCGMCSNWFGTERGIFRHIRTHISDNVDLCSEMSGLKDSLKVQIYQCRICKKYFHCQNALMTHIHIHTGQELYQNLKPASDSNELLTEVILEEENVQLTNQQSPEIQIKSENSENEIQAEMTFEEESSEPFSEIKFKKEKEELFTELTIDEETCEPNYEPRFSDIVVKKEVFETEFGKETIDVQPSNQKSKLSSEICIKEELTELGPESERFEYILGPIPRQSALGTPS